MINNELTWAHYQPVRIICSSDGLSLLPELLSGSKVLLVTSQGFISRGVVKQIQQVLAPKKVIVFAEVAPNPELELLDSLAQRFRDKGIEAVIGLGGGSALDSAKVLAAIIHTQEKQPLQRKFLENIPLAIESSLPLITIPTTAGTGAEVTPFATVWHRQTHSKFSLTGDFMYPHATLLVPELTLSLPWNETLNTGLDTLSHSLESLWNVNRTPVTELYAEKSIALLSKYFMVALEKPDDVVARQAMQTASVLAGLAISVTRTAIAHSISYPLTSHYGVPHGLACSFTLLAISKLVRYSGQLHVFQHSLESAELLLESLPVSLALSQYVTFQQIWEHRAEMFNPERANNFILNMDNCVLEQLLRNAINETESLNYS